MMLFSSLAIAQVKKASTTRIQFVNKDWSSILDMARKTHKPIFVDAYASWCAPCKEMKQNVFTNPGIANSFNQRFINFTVDIEKKAGIAFAERYQVNAYPTLLFIGGDGKEIKRMESYMDAKALAAFAADMH